MSITGEKCTKSGVYKCSNCCCGATISLNKGEVFPPCGACGKTYWTLLWEA